MEHASLLAFLNGNLSPEALGWEIATEVEASELGCKAKGVGHLILGGGPKEMISREQMRRFLKAMLDSSLKLQSAIYIADCMILSDDFEFADAYIEDVIYLISDESNCMNAEKIESILKNLK